MKINIISLVYQNENKLLTQQLIRESSFVTEFLVRKLQIYNFFDCKRINFICCKENVRTEVRLYERILEMDVLFDCKYFDMDSQKKQIYLYELLFDSFKILCEKKQWEFAILRKIFDDFKQNKFSNSFYTRLKCSKNKITARLLGVQKMDMVKFYLEFQGENGLGERKFLFSAKPNAFDYDRFLGRLEWKKDGEIVLFDKEGMLVCKHKIEVR